MANLVFGIDTRSSRAWWTAAALSSLLLILFLSRIDWEAVTRISISLDLGLLSLATGLLFAEGAVTALRIQTFANQNPTYLAALKANAWYVLSLGVLPARLGEVAAIVIFERLLGIDRGSAVGSVFCQRLIDFAILAFLMAVGSAFIEVEQWPVMVPITAVLISVGAVCGLLFFEIGLGMIATLVKSLREAYWAKQRRALLRIVLQARTWKRHHFRTTLYGRAVALTCVKWLFNLSAIAALLVAAGLELKAWELVLVVCLYNFLSVLPLQTVGGIGIGEVGLTVILSLFSVPLGLAAATTLIVRLVLIVFPFVFWSTVIATSRIVAPNPVNASSRGG